MADKRQLELLKSSVDDWNEWRASSDVEIDLSHSDLSNMNLANVDFSFAYLRHANLQFAHLENAQLSCADMRDVDLFEADLSHACCIGTEFAYANLIETNLSCADLQHADLSYTRLRGADITGACFCDANLNHTNVNDIIYRRKDMDGNYQGIRIDSCYGDAEFKRYAQDQDYIDTLRPMWSTGWRKVLFSWWKYTDYGRSILSVATVALKCVLAFGLLFYIPGTTTHTVKGFDTTPLYFSFVTFTTLGYGDVSANSTFGQFLVVIEVVLGYITLGLLLAVLANTVTRRS